MEPQGGRGPQPDKNAVSAAEREVRQHLQQLHDRGLINLDAPAREVIDAIDRNYPSPSEENVSAATAGYWLVGDQGWCNHL